MKSHMFVLLRAIITAVTLSSVVVFVCWSDFDHYVGWPVICAGFGAWAILVVLTLQAAAKHGSATAGIYAVPAICCAMLLASPLAIEDGSRDVRLRLTVAGAPQDQAARVVWSSPDAGRPRTHAGAYYVDRPWRNALNGGDQPEFESEAPVNFSIHTQSFFCGEGWCFRPEDRLIVIEVGEQRFRFEPASLFGKGGRGHSPKEIAATFDASEYLCGRKVPPPLDFAPDLSAHATDEGSE